MEEQQNAHPQPGLSARFTARWQTIDKTQWAQIVIAGVGKGMPWYLAHKVGRGRLASTHAARVNVLTAFLFVWKEQSMDEQDKLQQPPPPEPTPWERFLVIAKEEALWLAHTHSG